MLDMCPRGIPVLRQSCRYLEPILTKILVGQQVLVQQSKIKFNENSLSGSPVLSYVGNIRMDDENSPYKKEIIS
jgi:hypothetical protein